MNKHFLKTLRDKIPEPLKYIVTPFIRNRLIRNKEFCKYYNILENRKAITPEEIKEYQINQLKQILIYSFENVPYYKKLFKEINFTPENLNSFDDIKIIPFLTKEIIRENFDKLISLKKVKGGCYSTTTSGSTGEPLKLLLDYDSFFIENAFLYHLRKDLNYMFNDKLVTFRGIEFGRRLWRYNPINNETIFSPFNLSKKTLEIYLKEINEIKPSYFNGYFSSIYYFAKLLSENNKSLDFRLKGIFLSSENINEEERLFIESFFGVKSLTFYGHTERCVIAQEFGHNQYLFDPYYGFTEQIKIDDNSFEITGTGFLNKTMPLIRYKTGDICQSTNNNLISIKGRREINDFLVGRNDEKIFNSSLHFLSDILTNVTKYQFIQEMKGYAVLLLVPNKDFNTSELISIKEELDKKMNGIIDFEIKVKEKLILSSSGKYQMFISKI
jgi:phenylacetate-CoA ligase